MRRSASSALARCGLALAARRPAVLPARVSFVGSAGVGSAAPLAVVAAFRFGGRWVGLRWGCGSRAAAAAVLRSLRRSRAGLLRSFRVFSRAAGWRLLLPAGVPAAFCSARLRVGVFSAAGLVGRSFWWSPGALRFAAVVARRARRRAAVRSLPGVFGSPVLPCFRSLPRRWWGGAPVAPVRLPASRVPLVWSWSGFLRVPWGSLPAVLPVPPLALPPASSGGGAVLPPASWPSAPVLSPALAAASARPSAFSPPLPPFVAPPSSPCLLCVPRRFGCLRCPSFPARLPGGLPALSPLPPFSVVRG